MIQSQGIARKMICQKCERYRGPEGVLAVHCGCRGDRPCSNIVSLLRECPEKKWVGVAAPVPVVEAKPVAVDVHTAIRKARLGQAITAKEWDVLPQWMKNRSKRPAEAKYAPAPSPGSVFMLEDGEEVPGRHIRPKVGGSVFLLCGGPSLAKMNLELLRQPGIVTMGVNNSPAVFRPDMWVHVDAADRFLRSIWEDQRIHKFTPIGLKNGRIFDSDSWSYTEQKVTDCPNVSYYRRHEGFAAGEFLRGNSVCWGGKEGKSVMLAAIRILYELGFRKIYLLGADFRMAEDYGYAWAQGRAAAAVANNNRLYGALNDWFTQLRPLFEAAGLKVWNCTPESGLKAFDAMTLEEAVAEARLKIDVAKERTEGLYDKAKPDPTPLPEALRIMRDETRPMVIPRILHFVWLGSVRPEWVDRNIERARELHPGWEVMVHESIEVLPEDLRQAANHCEQYCQVADIIRIWALHRWGGIYLDSDITLFRNVDLLRKLPTFASESYEERPFNSVMGAIAGDSLVHDLLQQIRDIHRINGKPPRRTAYGPDLMKINRNRLALIPRQWFHYYQTKESCLKAYRDLEEERKRVTTQKWPNGVIPFGLHVAGLEVPGKGRSSFARVSSNV